MQPINWQIMLQREILLSLHGYFIYFTATVIIIIIISISGQVLAEVVAVMFKNIYFRLFWSV